jgi:hypothetical protein
LARTGATELLELAAELELAAALDAAALDATVELEVAAALDDPDDTLELTDVPPQPESASAQPSNGINRFLFLNIICSFPIKSMHIVKRGLKNCQ